MSDIQELKELVLAKMDNDKVRDEREKALEEKMKALEEASAEDRAKIEKLEKEPVQSKIVVPGTTQMVDVMYRGYNLRDQGLTVQIADPEKKERYAKFMLDIIRAEYFGDVEAKAALNEGTASQGGYLVPDEFFNEIMAFARLQSDFLKDCRIINMSGDTMKIPAESSNVSVAWAAEAATLSQSEPTFAEVELNPKKLGAFSVASQELLEDSAFDIVSLLTEQYAEAIATEIDTRVLQAGNSSTFTGALSGAGNTVTQSATGGWAGHSADDLSNMIAQLASNKIAGAKFYFSRTGFHYTRVLKDSQNNYIFAQPGNGVPGSVWEYPYVVTEGMPSTNSTGNYIALFANMRYYGLGVRRLGMNLAMDPYGLFTKDQVRFKMTVRIQGKPLLSGGLVALKGKS